MQTKVTGLFGLAMPSLRPHKATKGDKNMTLNDPRKGQCHCGATRYEATGQPIYHAACHCGDCRRATGAPMVSWALFPKDAVTISGDEPRVMRTPEFQH